MKFKKERVALLASNLTDGLVKGGFIVPAISNEELSKKIENTITEDLMIEEKLNEEVREILKSHSKQLEQENVNYQRMFQMVKDQLVRERGIIL